MTFSIPTSGQPNSPSRIKRSQPKPPMMAEPQFGHAVKAGGRDEVRFGKLPAPPAEQDDVPEFIAPKKDKQPGRPDPNGAKPGKYGRLQNNVREGARIVLCDFLPLALSVPMLGGVPGFMLAMAGMPISYAAGKTGRWLAKDVDQENLIPVFKYVSAVKGALFAPPGSNNGQVVDLLNQATDDFLNIRGGGAVKAWLFQKLLLNKDKGVGRMLTKFSIWRAEVNIRLARATNLSEAGKAAAGGVKDFALYSILNKIGTGMAAVGGGSFLLAPIRWIGRLMQHAAWVKIAADVMRSPKPAEKA